MTEHEKLMILATLQIPKTPEITDPIKKLEFKTKQLHALILTLIELLTIEQKEKFTELLLKNVDAAHSQDF